MRTLPSHLRLGLNLGLLLALLVPGCTNECDKLHTRLQACGYGATMPSRAKFIAQCRASKAQFKVMLRCAEKRDCKDFRECVEAADATFSTDNQESVPQVAKRLRIALQSRNHADALQICSSKRKDFTKTMRNKCDMLQAAHLVRGLRAARLEAAFTDLQDYCWQHRSVIGNRTRVQCKNVRQKLYDFLRRQALRVRDHGPYDDLASQCKSLTKAGQAIGPTFKKSALALCDDLNVAEPAAKAIAVVEKELVRARKGMAEVKRKPSPKSQPAMKVGSTKVFAEAEPVALPYQCGSVVKTLEKHGSKFALRRRDELVRLCHVRIGRLILARDATKKECSFHGGKVLAAIRRYKLTDPALDPLVAGASKRCEDKAAREARAAQKAKSDKSGK